jgi:coatomer subunit beta
MCYSLVYRYRRHFRQYHIRRVRYTSGLPYLYSANNFYSEKGVDSNVVILNDVHVDIMDYIKPAQCTETQFRTMWTEFEWENKVNINSKAKTLREFLKQLMASTNMSCLTPEASMKGDCQFLSANLYARSVFGE